MENKETLEEAADKFSKELSQVVAFYEGAKWQQGRSYSEEEVEDIINSFEKLCYNYQNNKDWFPAKKSEWIESRVKNVHGIKTILIVRIGQDMLKLSKESERFKIKNMLVI
jgi:hypothetical protein